MSGGEKIGVFLTERQWSLVRESLAHQHNLVLKRKSWKPSERAVACVDLSEIVDAIEATVPTVAPGR